MDDEKAAKMAEALVPVIESLVLSLVRIQHDGGYAWVGGLDTVNMADKITTVFTASSDIHDKSGRLLTEQQSALILDAVLERLVKSGELVKKAGALYAGMNWRIAGPIDKIAAIQ